MEEKRNPLLDVITSPMNDSIDQPIVSSKEEPQDKEEENISIIFGKKREMSEKYKVSLAKKAVKNPNAVEVKTKEGWMTVKEAIEKGYDPKTGEFTQERLEPLDTDKYFQHRSKEGREKIKRKINPRGTNVDRKQMEAMGEKPEEHPDFMPNRQPQEAQAPQEKAPQEEAVNPIAAMLAGGVS